MGRASQDGGRAPRAAWKNSDGRGLRPSTSWVFRTTSPADDFEAGLAGPDKPSTNGILEAHAAGFARETSRTTSGAAEMVGCSFTTCARAALEYYLCARGARGG